MTLSNGDKALVTQLSWNVCKEAIMEHQKNCPVKWVLEVKKAHVYGFLLGVLLCSGIGSGSVVTIILAMAGKL